VHSLNKINIEAFTLGLIAESATAFKASVGDAANEARRATHRL
jgi:hypothetical protein